MEDAIHDGTEWVFGATSPDCIFAVPEYLRKDYLPQGEIQRGREDFMDCVSRGVVNPYETKFTYALQNNLIIAELVEWLRAKKYIVKRQGREVIEFSDRFIAIKSGTTRTGNSMKAPAHATHEWGLIPKSMLPSNSKMRWSDYHDASDITPEMEALGKEFIKRFSLNYEQVYLADLEALLKRDMVNLAGYAWPRMVNGEYPRTEGPFSHAFMGFGLPTTYIFDNYPDDDFDGEWIKKLASNYNLYEYGYRVFVRNQMIPSEYEKTLSLIARIWKRFQELLEEIRPLPAYDQDPSTLPMNQEDPKPTEPISLSEELYQEAVKWLGKDASPKNLAPDDLACAESVSHIISQITPWTAITGTWTLNSHLNLSPKFEKVAVNNVRPGDVLVYPTGELRAPFVGHAFICGKNGVLMSNTSATGKWEENYTLATARARWEGVGYHPHFYRLKSK